ncbi:MAG: FAD-binding oxidoreductase [Thermaerobacterales bacterium]
MPSLHDGSSEGPPSRPPVQSPRYDAIVVGGGLIGYAAAYQLVRRGARTLLFDRGDPGRATDAGAGIISRWGSIGAGPRSELAWRAAVYYPELLAMLDGDGAGETGYARPGRLMVAVSDDELPEFARKREQMLTLQAEGSGGSDLVDLNVCEAQQMFPPLGRVRSALYDREAARVDGRMLRAALQRAAQARGLYVQAGSVNQLMLQGDRVVGVTAEGKPAYADRVIIAGGAWSGIFGSQLGVSLPVTPQRGQIVHLKFDDRDTTHWPIITPCRSHYMVCWDDGRVVVGASRETGSGYRPQLTAGGIHEVLDEALRTAPGLKDARIHEMRVGLRPRTPDDMPVLGPVPGVAAVHLATGHGSGGLQQGPYSAMLVVAQALGDEPEMPLDAFSVSRFGRA